MATQTKPRMPQSDTYLELIRRFPLKPIRNDAEHELAVDIIGKMMGRRLDGGSGGYLDTLILLVNKYEDEHHSPQGTHLTPQQALKAIMNAGKLTQADIGRIIGSESAVSMFLSGERGLSKAHIKALAEQFRIDAAVFL